MMGVMMGRRRDALLLSGESANAVRKAVVCQAGKKLQELSGDECWGDCQVLLNAYDPDVTGQRQAIDNGLFEVDTPTE